MNRIFPPYTPVQIEAMRRFQESGLTHPMTCGFRYRHPYNEGVLEPATHGLFCPAIDCDYSQGWAYDLMVDTEWLEAHGAHIARLIAEQQES